MAAYKIVNVQAKMKVGIVDPPIYGTVKNIKMSMGDIIKCLTMRAAVEEVMPDGSTIPLNMTNYHHDFLSEWEKKHGKKERIIPTPPETKTVNPPAGFEHRSKKDKKNRNKHNYQNTSFTAEVKAEEKKDSVPANSTETADEAPKAPTSINEVKAPVVETRNESADTPAVDTPEN